MEAKKIEFNNGSVIKMLPVSEPIRGISGVGIDFMWFDDLEYHLSSEKLQASLWNAMGVQSALLQTEDRPNYATSLHAADMNYRRLAEQLPLFLAETRTYKPASPHAIIEKTLKK